MNFDMSVPVPEQKSRRYNFDDMPVGASRLFPEFRSTYKAAPYLAAKDSESWNGFKFTGRATPEGLRIWRVE